MNQPSESIVEPLGNEQQQEPEHLHLFDLHSLASFQDERPSAHIVSDDPRARLVLLSFKAGQQVKEHHTRSLLFVQAVRGRVSFTALEKSVELEAGAIVRVEANIPHHVTALSDAVLLLTMTPSPAAIRGNVDAASIP